MKLERAEFLKGLAAAAVLPSVGCVNAGASGPKGRFLFGACRPLEDAALLKRVGFDFIECAAADAFLPKEGEEAWKRQRDLILALPLPLRSCNGFLPGTFRLTGPKADFAPALAYAETVLRRAEEVGVKCIVFGSGGARNVPGDMTLKGEERPDTERGRAQYTEFCRLLCDRVKDLRTVEIVIEPLRPRESNIINYVWEGAQICHEVNSPRLKCLADIFHMMMGHDEPDSLLKAGANLRHCHIASYETRSYPGSDPRDVERFRPYFDALRQIGYTGGISCECKFSDGWNANAATLERTLPVALATLKSL